MPKKYYARRFKKRPRKVARRSRFPFAKRVLSVLNKQRELKIGQSMSHIVQADADISLNNQLLRILGPISQGINEYERIGNSIILKKIVINAYYAYDNTNQNFIDQKALIRHMVLKQKNSNSGENVVGGAQPFLNNNLLENSGPYHGSITDFNTPINRNCFTVRKQIKRTMSLPVTHTANIQATGANVSRSYTMVNYTLTFGKGKVLNFRTSGQTYSADFPYFIAHSAAPMGEPAWTGGNSPVTFYMTATPYFYDN